VVISTKKKPKPIIPKKEKGKKTGSGKKKETGNGPMMTSYREKKTTKGTQISNKEEMEGVAWKMAEFPIKVKKKKKGGE